MLLVENIENIKDRGAMHYAAAAVGRVNALKYLIKDMKLYVDFIDNTGETPLSWAAIDGCLAAMDYLLKIGVNPEIPDDSNSSPLHHEAIPTDVGIKPLLLSEDFDCLKKINKPF
ncbi:hypothetical protein MKW98_019932 [Papaver atlanticum]|uniref:Uncharacterized protein n=1 Tax=Papaver atlanticum TaxID=357466 RepID=A0AAD4S130_9MAGN|nr:hypothetical protein MKW98_019932 [Papaver atlanticum]